VKLLVIGANGGTGRQVVTQALDAGHDVTAFVRNRSTLTPQHPRCTVVEGDAAGGALQDVVRDHDAVISTLGRGLSFKPERLMERSVPLIIAAMQAGDVRRLVFTSALGVGESYQDSPIIARIFFRTLLRRIYADKLVGDRLIRASGLDWTIVQPAQMNDGPLTRHYRSGERLAMSGMPAISRADTAHFILDRLNDQSSIGRTIVLAN
jgi:putative NADH-flavin reductase